MHLPHPNKLNTSSSRKHFVFPCRHTGRDLLSFLLCLSGGGLLGNSISYYFSVLFILALVEGRHGFYDALTRVPWYIKLILPVVTIPNVSASRILIVLVTFGLLIRLAYVMFVLGKCDHCSRPLSGNGGVIRSKKCR